MHVIIIFYVWHVKFPFFVSITMCVFVPTPVVPLTPSNVMRAVREVEEWWGEFDLGGYLFIPELKRKEIRQNFPDEMDQKKQAISYWINTDPLASWRRLIRALDGMRETKLADSIRSNAEPLTGIQVCTCILVLELFTHIMPHTVQIIFTKHYQLACKYTTCT